VLAAVNPLALSHPESLPDLEQGLNPAALTGYVPLAAIDQTLGKSGKVGRASIHYVHTDHLGTPQEMTDANGKISWSVDYSAWGERQHALILNAEEEAETRTDCAIRFQGQYFDAETGLHYNTFRYYDPGCGRFISPDPINLLGGMNLYQYAPDAWNWIDPWGWKKKSGSRKPTVVENKQTGRTGPKNKVEASAMDHVKKHPENGNIIRSSNQIGDPFYKTLGGNWVKMEKVVNGVTVHYMAELDSQGKIIKVADYKFKPTGAVARPPKSSC
jgi:RHS repeat-associated protein